MNINQRLGFLQNKPQDSGMAVSVGYLRASLRTGLRYSVWKKENHPLTDEQVK